MKNQLQVTLNFASGNNDVKIDVASAVSIESRRGESKGASAFRGPSEGHGLHWENQYVNNYTRDVCKQSLNFADIKV